MARILQPLATLLLVDLLYHETLVLFKSFVWGNLILLQANVDQGLLPLLELRFSESILASLGFKRRLSYRLQNCAFVSKILFFVKMLILRVKLS